MNDQKTLKLTNGNPVTGDRFWDREADLRLLIQYLEEGAHVSLIAQRRIGQTSLMLEAARRIADRFLCLSVDLQKSHSPADAVTELAAATRLHAPLWRKTKDVFAGFLRTVGGSIESLQLEEVKVTLRGGLTSGDWQAKGDGLFEVLASANKPVVVFLDEVPVLINRLLKGDDYSITPERRQQTDAFLSWLRANGLRHKDRVRLVVSGSIGLEPILHQAGLSATMAHLTPFELEPWDRATSLGCLGALAAEYKLTLKLDPAEEMLDRLGVCIPHHVQMYFDHVRRYCLRRNLTEVTKQVAAEVYEHSMLNIRGHVDLSHFEERLKIVLGPELQPLALSLLTEAATTGKLLPESSLFLAREHLADHPRREEELREIFGILEHDGYLRQQPDGSYVFVSKLLRDWWKRRFGHTYTPAARR